MAITQFKEGLVSINPTSGIEVVIANQRQLDRAVANGLNIEDTSAVAPPPPLSADRGALTKGGKKRLTKEEADSLADMNLSESFGMPSALVELGEGAAIELVVLDFIEQQKKSGKGTFPAAQVAYKSTQFCILYDRRMKIGDVLDADVVSSINETTKEYRTASKLTIQIVWE
jgi:hypothetical protein